MAVTVMVSANANVADAKEIAVAAAAEQRPRVSVLTVIGLSRMYVLNGYFRETSKCINLVKLSRNLWLCQAAVAQRANALLGQN